MRKNTNNYKTTHTQDISKVESDIILEFTSIDNDEELLEGAVIVETLSKVVELGTVPVLTVQLKSEKWKRAWNTILKLRQITSKIVQFNRNVVQMSAAWYVNNVSVIYCSGYDTVSSSCHWITSQQDNANWQPMVLVSMLKSF